MRIDVGFDCSRKGVTTYSIHPKLRQGRSNPSQEEQQRLADLQPRIEEMARRKLGDAFLSLQPFFPFGVFLNVKQGTPVKMKFELRELLGWIALCDNEKQ